MALASDVAIVVFAVPGGPKRIRLYTEKEEIIEGGNEERKEERKEEMKEEGLGMAGRERQLERVGCFLTSHHFT